MVRPSLIRGLSSQPLPNGSASRPSALRHRYTEQHVQAVRELLKPDPLIDVVLEPFLTVVDSDLEGISLALDKQLKLRERMRTIVSEEFTALFGENAPKQLGFVRNPRR